MISLRIIIICIVLFCIFNSVTYSQKSLIYDIRSNNRMEGIKKLPIDAPDFEILSFTSYIENFSLDSNVILQTKFYLLEEAKLQILARELIPIKYYEMCPLKTDWSKGWKIFSPWETAEVLTPLNLTMDLLGIVGKIIDDEQKIIPLVVFHSKHPKKINYYKIIIRPKESLARIRFIIRRMSDNKIIIDKPKRTKFEASIPVRISIDFSDQNPGYYEIEFKCRIVEEPSGPHAKYIFYHQSIVK